MNNSLDFKPKELNKMTHIESFVDKDKTIVEYKPHIWSNKEYIVGKLEKIKDKKNGDRTQYTLVYKSKNLDSSIFIYHNLHVIEIMKMNRKKNLLKMDIQEKENVSKVLLLESDLQEQENKKLVIAKSKELKVNVITVVDYDEICME